MRQTNRRRKFVFIRSYSTIYDIVINRDRHVRQIGAEITKRDARAKIVPADADSDAGIARRGLKFLKGRPERLGQ